MMKILMRLMNKALPSCQDVSHLSSQAMDESLPLRKRLALSAHLMMCVWCRRNREQLHLMRRQARREDCPSVRGLRLSPDAHRRIAETLSRADDRP
jgi:hypothetical protein